MKKCIKILFLTLLCFSLIGCSKTTNDSSTEEVDITPSEESTEVSTEKEEVLYKTLPE
jgi:ABC-type Fe3+-citrate transport system substrate-binding protein